MPCCGKSTSRSTYMGIPGSPRFTQTGVIQLRAMDGCGDADCIGPYSGERRNDIAYLVGWGTEHERLFRSTESHAAIAWARHLGGGPQQLRNDRVMLSELPTRAVEQLYSG